MFSVSVDDKGKKIVITFKDHFDVTQAEQFYARIKEIVPGLEKGFGAVTDMSSLEQMDINAKPLIEKVMDLLDKSGISKIVRIIPEQGKDIGFNIMSSFHYSSQVKIHICETYQEAMKYFKK